MVYTMVLLLVILYTFSCLSMEIVTPQRNTDNELIKNIVDTHFSSLPQTMLTFFQFVCLDSVAAIYKPLIEHAPWLVFFFVTLILTVSIVLMNLVTAVVVNGAFETAQQDRDAVVIYEQEQKARMMQELRDIFVSIDEDGSGVLSAEEILGINGHDLETLKHLTSMEEPLDIIRMLDVDGDGEIRIDEFLHGLWQVVVSKVPPELRLELRRMQKNVNDQTKQIQKSIESLSQKIDRVCSNTNMGDAFSTNPHYVGLAGEADARNYSLSNVPGWAEGIISELQTFREEFGGDFLRFRSSPHCLEGTDSKVRLGATADHRYRNVADIPDLTPAIMVAARTSMQHLSDWSIPGGSLSGQFGARREAMIESLSFQQDVPQHRDLSQPPVMSQVDPSCFVRGSSNAARASGSLSVEQNLQNASTGRVGALAFNKNFEHAPPQDIGSALGTFCGDVEDQISAEVAWEGEVRLHTTSFQVGRASQDSMV